MPGRMGIVLYVLAGLLLSVSNTIFFFQSESAPLLVKYCISSVMTIIAVAIIIAGFKFRGFVRWRRDLGALLLGTAAYDSLLVLTFACVLLSPALEEFWPPERRPFMGDYPSGAGYLTLLLAGGAAFLLIDRRRQRNSGS